MSDTSAIVLSNYRHAIIGSHRSKSVGVVVAKGKANGVPQCGRRGAMRTNRLYKGHTECCRPVWCGRCTVVLASAAVSNKDRALPPLRSGSGPILVPPLAAGRFAFGSARGGRRG